MRTRQAHGMLIAMLDRRLYMVLRKCPMPLLLGSCWRGYAVARFLNASGPRPPHDVDAILKL